MQKIVVSIITVTYTDGEYEIHHRYSCRNKSGTLFNTSQYETVRSVECELPDLSESEQIEELSIKYVGPDDRRVSFDVSSIEHLTTLKHLYLNNINVLGDLTHVIKRPLKVLEIRGISGSLWSKMADCIKKNGVKLKYLSVEDATVTADQMNGTVHPKLEELTVKRCTVDQSILDSISTIYTLDTVTVTRCNLTGTIPESISDLKYLHNIDLSHNQLTGTIPDVLFTPMMECIDLSHNELTGTVPESVGRAEELTTLMLSHNKLSGIIPTAVFRIEALETIELYKSGVNIQAGGIADVCDISCITRNSKGTLKVQYMPIK